MDPVMIRFGPVLVLQFKLIIVRYINIKFPGILNPGSLKLALDEQVANVDIIYFQKNI